MDLITKYINEAVYGTSLGSFSTIDDSLIKIKEIISYNHRALYSELKYVKNPSSFDTNDYYTLEILRAIRFWGFNFDLFYGEAYMPFIKDFSGTIDYRKDKIWKIYDKEKQFTCEFRIDSDGTKKNVYVLFFKRPHQIQGNYYEFKHFIIYQIKLIFFDFLQYNSIMGRAIYSSNSEIKNTGKGDWRLKPKVWKVSDDNLLRVTGLKYLYLKMGFQLGELVDPSLDPKKDYVVLLNKNI